VTQYPGDDEKGGIFLDLSSTFVHGSGVAGVAHLAPRRIALAACRLPLGGAYRVPRSAVSVVVTRHNQRVLDMSPDNVLNQRSPPSSGR